MIWKFVFCSKYTIENFRRSEGGIYTENLRGATQTDNYILRGDPNGEIYEPR
jgi:hypothetical protein